MADKYLMQVKVARWPVGEKFLCSKEGWGEKKLDIDRDKTTTLTDSTNLCTYRIQDYVLESILNPPSNRR